MVNALHHPPKGAFSQSADNFICNTKKKSGKERESGERGNRSLRLCELDQKHILHRSKDRRRHTSQWPFSKGCLLKSEQLQTIYVKHGPVLRRKI